MGKQKIENKANCKSKTGIVIGNRLVLSPQINIMIRFIQPAYYASIVNKAKSGLHVHIIEQNVHKFILFS